MHRLDLRGPQLVVGPALPPLGDQLGHALHAGQEGAGRQIVCSGVMAGQCAHRHEVGWLRCCGLQPLFQHLGPKKRKHPTRTGLWVQPVGELGLDPGGLEQKGQGPAPSGQGGGQALGIALRLRLHAFEGDAFFFSLDHAASFAVHIKQIVGKAMAGVEWEFADGHTLRCMQINLVDVANLPASGLQELVNLDAGFGFGGHSVDGNCF